MMHATSRPLRILHFLGVRRLPSDPDAEATGGLARVALELAKVQVGMGHQVWVATSASPGWRSKWEGIRLVGISAPRWPWVTRGPLSPHGAARLALLRYDWVHGFDVVHGHEYVPRGGRLGAVRIAHLHNSPFSSRSASPSEGKARSFWAAARRAHAHVVVSRYVAEQVERSRRTAGLPHALTHPVFVVPNGVDSERFHCARALHDARALRMSWGASERDIVFLYSGAVAPQKGVLHLAHAFLRLRREVPTIRLAVAGAWDLWGGGGAAFDATNAAYEEQLRSILAPAVRVGHVVMLGLVPPARMPAVYNASDVVVVPSVVMEAFGLAALEAMAAGKPVVASRVGGLPEMLDETVGYLVPPGDEGALADAMRELAGSADRRRECGDAAHSRAQRFSWQAAASELDLVYRKVASRLH